MAPSWVDRSVAEAAKAEREEEEEANGGTGFADQIECDTIGQAMLASNSSACIRSSLASVMSLPGSSDFRQLGAQAVAYLVVNGGIAGFEGEARQAHF